MHGPVVRGHAYKLPKKIKLALKVRYHPSRSRNKLCLENFNVSGKTEASKNDTEIWPRIGALLMVLIRTKPSASG